MNLNEKIACEFEGMDGSDWIRLKRPDSINTGCGEANHSVIYIFLEIIFNLVIFK